LVIASARAGTATANGKSAQTKNTIRRIGSKKRPRAKELAEIVKHGPTGAERLGSA
jgi:hypothetical protein